MIEDKDKRRCMRFVDGRLVEADPPDWFERHLARNDDTTDWSASLVQEGCIGIDEFGDAETIEIFRHPSGSYYVEYRDTIEAVAWIFIDRPVDYVTFRATFLAPLALLSMESERFEEVLDERRKRRAGAR